MYRLVRSTADWLPVNRQREYWKFSEIGLSSSYATSESNRNLLWYETHVPIILMTWIIYYSLYPTENSFVKIYQRIDRPPSLLLDVSSLLLWIVQLRIRSIYLFSVSINRNSKKHISMDSNHKLAVLETAVLPITPPMYTKECAAYTTHSKISKIYKSTRRSPIQ